MTLPFQQIWPERMGELAGQPNYFVEKIIRALDMNFYSKVTLMDLFAETADISLEEFKKGSCNPYFPHIPKIHTIREDKSNRWKSGNDIHFVINNVAKNRLQFAPLVKCVSVQKIQIIYKNYMGEKIPTVTINSIEYVFDPYFQFSDPESCGIIEELAINDGFPSTEAFFQYFNEDFTGKIIHWTDLKY